MTRHPKKAEEIVPLELCRDKQGTSEFHEIQDVASPSSFPKTCFAFDSPLPDYFASTKENTGIACIRAAKPSNLASCAKDQL